MTNFFTTALSTMALDVIKTVRNILDEIKIVLSNWKYRVILEIMLYLMIFQPIKVNVQVELNFPWEIEEKTEIQTQKDTVKALGATYSIFDYITPRNEKEAAQIEYVRKYHEIALEEQKIYNIPASITLAQGLLESQAGLSLLAIESNNHFGIKCSKECLGCTCRNYKDDTRFDMFRVFNSDLESYKEHSKFLLKDRYKPCFEAKEYKGWAHALKKCGYATNPRYAYLLINLIERYALYEFDSKTIV